MQKDILIEYYPDVHSKTSLATYDYQMLLDSSKNYKVDYFTGKQRDTQMAALAFALQPELPDTAEIAKINGVDYQMTKASFIDMLNRKDDYLATILFETKVDLAKQQTKIKQATNVKAESATSDQEKPKENQVNKQIIEYQPTGSHAYKEVDFKDYQPAGKEKVRKIGLSRLSYVFNYHDLKSLLTGKHATELFSKPIGVVPSNGKITANRRKSFSDNAGLDIHALDNAEATKIGTVENTVNKNKYTIYTFTVNDNTETKPETKKADAKVVNTENKTTKNETKAANPKVQVTNPESKVTEPKKAEVKTIEITKPETNTESEESSENMMPNTTKQAQVNTQSQKEQEDMSQINTTTNKQTPQTDFGVDNTSETQPMSFPNALLDGNDNSSAKDKMDFVAQMFNGNNSNTNTKQAAASTKANTQNDPRTETKQTVKSEPKAQTTTNLTDTDKVEHKLDSINRKLDQVLIATSAVKNAVAKDQTGQTNSVLAEDQPIGPNPKHDAKDETLQELIARQSNLTKAQLKLIPQNIINFCFSKNAVSPMARANAIFKLNEILMKGPIPDEYKCLTDPELYLKVVHLLSWFN